MKIRRAVSHLVYSSYCQCASEAFPKASTKRFRFYQIYPCKSSISTQTKEPQVLLEVLLTHRAPNLTIQVRLARKRAL
jgi:hypothetical protein